MARINLTQAIERLLELGFTSEEGKTYELNDETATLLVRPRGWHLPERHLQIGGEPIAARLSSISGCTSFVTTTRGGTLVLPAEARVAPRGAALERRLRAGRRSGSACRSGTIKATVLIETILAAFEMDEILYELREHSAGLNAGRWDYIFSVIKKLGHRPEFVLPDRGGRDDGGAVHARLHGAARQDVPPRAARTRWAAWPRSSPRAAIPR